MRHLLKTLLPQLSNQLLFRWQQLKYSGINKRFKKQHPDLPLPNPYTLYETYNLNYKKYMEDGKLTASEIFNSVKKQLPTVPEILDWGCGPARITRHLKSFWENATITGIDTNIITIEWNKAHFNNIHFFSQNQYPPLPFNNNHFDFIIGFSVLTHIPAEDQQAWLTELNRILKPEGIAWITTHGNHFIDQLPEKQKKLVRSLGIYNTSYPITGHRMMCTYHHPDTFKKIFEESFELLTYFDGNKNPEKAGKQDLWVGRKTVDVRSLISDL